MKLVPSLLVFAIAGGIVPAAEAGQTARPDTVRAQSGDMSKIRTIGVCHPAPNNNYSLDNVVIPITEAGYYLQQFDNRNPPGSATTTILQPPKHGVLRLVTEADGNRFGEGRFVAANQLYVYLPDSNYVGKDTATIQVDFGNGLKVNVKYYFQAVDHGLGDDWVGDYCGKTGPFWRISSILDTNAVAATNCRG